MHVVREFIGQSSDVLRKTAPPSEQILNSSEELPKKRVCLKALYIDIQLFKILKVEINGLFWNY